MQIGQTNGRTQKKKKNRKNKSTTASLPLQCCHLALRGLPLLPVEVLGGTGLLVPRGSPTLFVQYLKIDSALLLLFFLLLGESRAGAVAGRPASVSGGARPGALSARGAGARSPRGRRDRGTSACAGVERCPRSGPKLERMHLGALPRKWVRGVKCKA